MGYFVKGKDTDFLTALKELQNVRGQHNRMIKDKLRKRQACLRHLVSDFSGASHLHDAICQWCPGFGSSRSYITASTP